MGEPLTARHAKLSDQNITSYAPRCDDNDPLTVNDVCTSGICMGASPTSAPTPDPSPGPTPFSPVPSSVPTSAPSPAPSVTRSCYTLLMYDSWGDGWNGNSWHWTPPSGVTITGTLAQGSYGTAQICHPPGTCGMLHVDDSGTWDSEVSWTLTDPAGAAVVSGLADNIHHEIGVCVCVYVCVCVCRSKL